jgi:hypothetical protein
MPDQVQAPIEFTAGQNTTADVLGGAMPTVRNALYDAADVTHVRPGLAAWDAFPAAQASGSAVIGMVAWKQYLVYVTEDRKLHAVTGSGGHYELSSDAISTSKLDGDDRPSFVAGRQMLCVSGGGEIQKWTGTGFSARLSASAPTAGDICGIAMRLVAQRPNDTGHIWWSEPLEVYDGWDMATNGAGYIQAGAKPDKLTAITDTTNEIFCWGEETLQVFAPSNIAVDGTDSNNLLDFAPSRTLNIGVTAKDAIVGRDDAFYVLDRNRRVLVTDGRGYQDISGPMVKRLRDLGTVSDCWGFRMRYSRYDCIVFVFPTEDVALVYDALQNKWSEWTEWTTAGPTSLSFTSAYYWADQAVFLVGLTSGRIVQLDDEAGTDLGNPIKIQLISGFVDHGSPAQKVSNALAVQYRRRFTATATSGHVLWSVRDYEGAWRELRMLELSADHHPSTVMRSLGTYRQRQYMQEYTGSDGFDFVSAVETFENLGA